MFVVVVSVGAVATLLFTGLYGSRIFFDPHRPYQPNRLKQNALTRFHFLVYLSCTLKAGLILIEIETRP